LKVPTEVNAVAGHTMTKIGDTKLLVIGGFSRKNYFSEWMYEYDAANSSWKKYDQHTDLIGAPVGMCHWKLLINLLLYLLFLFLPEIDGKDSLYANPLAQRPGQVKLDSIICLFDGV
jgi:hypothetical protein